MMNKRLAKKIVVILFIIIMCYCLKKIGGEGKMKYNNEDTYQKLITYKYDENEFYSIQENLSRGNGVDLFEVIPRENIECARKTEEIQYLILMSETNEKLFVFFDNQYKVTGTYYIKDEFLKEDDFADVQTGITPISEICKLDENRVIFPFNTDLETSHIIKEGMIIITYSRIKDGEILEDPVAETITIYNNDEILEIWEDDFFIQYTPFILPIDKQ